MKRKIFFKLNRVSIIIFFLLIILVVGCFFQYFHERYPKDVFLQYDEIADKCVNGKNESSYCKWFAGDEVALTDFLNNNNPRKSLEKLDAITLTGEIIRNTSFYVLQPLSALLIVIMVICRNHTELGSAMYRNFLTRQSHKKYLKNKIVSVLKIASIMPILLMIVFFVSCVITKFNFKVNLPMVANSNVYFLWKYEHFFLYGFFICLIQYLVSFFYGVLALVASFKNRNGIISIIMGYVFCVISNVFIYLVIGVGLLQNVLQIEVVTDMNIFGYWFFYEDSNYWLILLNCICIILVALGSFWWLVHNKERVVIENEKQVA